MDQVKFPHLFSGSLSIQQEIFHLSAKVTTAGPCELCGFQSEILRLDFLEDMQSLTKRSQIFPRFT